MKENMKKITLFIVIIACFVLIGCGQKTAKNQEVENTNETCISMLDNSEMTLDEAQSIAENSTCNQGKLKETHICNENTGTWWIDLDIVKEGCSPACVVNVSTKQAEINWRCTGLIQE